MKTRNSNSNAMDKDKAIKIRLLCSFACLDAIDQFPGTFENIDNWIIACEHCNVQLQGGNKRSKVKKIQSTSDLDVHNH